MIYRETQAEIPHVNALQSESQRGSIYNSFSPVNNVVYS